MAAVARTDTSTLGRWWWTVDRWSLAALGSLVVVGAVLIGAASPPVAERIGLDDFHFVRRHLIMLLPALGIMLAISLMSATAVRRLAFAVLVLSLPLLGLTLVMGAEIKGATRWIDLPGIGSVQPSEFVKPAMAVAIAWLFQLACSRRDGHGYVLALVLFAGVMGLLLLQPDLGMAVVVTAAFGLQIFLAGLALPIVVILAGLAVGGAVGSYYLFDHVASRIDRFLDPSTGDSYQIDRSLEAFAAGGMWGVGPGQGEVKLHLPDAHADFIFAVAGEEFGLVWCLLLVGLYGVVVLRACSRLGASGSLFTILAAAGLIAQFGLQSLVNIGSSLHLIPTKGMTLPFVSYGGSSLLALALTMGMLLALTRRRPGEGMP